MPVYLLLDTSGSMKGEPIEAVNAGLSVLASSMKQNPFALESVWISIMTFDLEVKEIIPLTHIEDLIVPHISTPSSGPTHLGLALKALESKVKIDVKKTSVDSKGDWAPFLFVMTDGKPSDAQLFKEYVIRIRQAGFGKIIGCAAGPNADVAHLETLCDQTVSLSNMDINAFSNLFEWVSQIIGNDSQNSRSVKEPQLPPPPKELQIHF